MSRPYCHSPFLFYLACASLVAAVAVVGRWYTSYPAGGVYGGVLWHVTERDTVTSGREWGRESIQWIQWPSYVPPDDRHLVASYFQPTWAFAGIDFAAHPLDATSSLPIKRVGRTILQAVTVHVPYWLVLLPFLVLPTCMMGSWLRFRRHQRQGWCPYCSYDLRATPERCPECGQTVAVARAEERAMRLRCRVVFITVLVLLSLGTAWIGIGRVIP